MPKRVYDWSAIQRYHDEGHGFVECSKRFGFGHTAWIKAIRRGELQTHEREFADRRRRYDWAAVQAYYDKGHSYRQCRAKFGFCASSWEKARARGEIVTRSRGMPIQELLARPSDRRNVKLRLLRAGLLGGGCSECGITEWRGRRLSLHLDHVNGVHNDHRLENLRLLCPNCHSQTETYGGRNVRRLGRLQDPRGRV